MNKKIIAFLVSAMYVFTAFVSVSYGADDAVPYSTNKDLAVINAVNPNYTLPSDATHFTRIEFVRLLIDAMCPQAETPKETGFSDVDASDPHASSLVFARDAGIISKADSFNPYDNVTYTQALKMAVTAAGYQPLADVKGGYPTGYLTLANELDLTDSLSASGDVSLTIDDGLKLITNLFDAVVFVQTGFTDSPVYEAKEGKTFINLYHQIETVYGLMNANEFSSVSDLTDAVNKGLVKIGTVNYKAGTDCTHLLGYNIKAYVNSDKEIIYADKYDTEEVVIFSSDIEDVNGFEVITYSGTKEIKYRLDDSFKYIKNGKAAPITAYDFDPYFIFDTGTITLVDNNGDSRFDVAIATEYTYSLVSKVSAYEKIIYDANSSLNSIILRDDADYVIKSIMDGEANEITLKQIPVGSLIAYTVSNDGLLYNITVLNDIIEGKITAVDDEYIYINDVAYKTADYYNTYYSHIALGSEGVFCIGIDGKVAAAGESGENYMKYGYFVDIHTPSGIGDEQIKIFSQSGKMEILTLPKSIIVDNISTPKSALKTTLMAMDEVSRFIRYSANENGELKRIDIKDEAQNNEFELGGKDAGNSLTRFSTGTYTFKSGINIFSSSSFSYHIDQSTFNFIIPPSASARGDDSKYGVVSSSFFGNDSSYSSMSAYDLDKSGCARATLIFADKRSSVSLGLETSTTVIEKVTEGLDPNGEKALVVYAWKGNKYEIYYSDERLSEADVSSLNPGDLVRLVTDENNIILNLIVDFKTSDYSIAASERQAYGNVTEYVMGIAYSASDSYINLMTNYEPNNVCPQMPSSYTLTDIRNLNISKAPVVFVDLVKDRYGNVISALPRMSEITDIKSYLDSGSNANIIVSRQRYLSPSLTVVYNVTVK